VTSPATNKTPEDQRRKNCHRKKDEARVDETLLQRVHRLGWFDGRNRFAHDSPLDDVRDHEQVETDQRRGTPPAGLRFANAGFAVAGNSDTRSRSLGKAAYCFQFPTDATTFHKVREFTPKHVRRQPATACESELMGSLLRCLNAVTTGTLGSTLQQIATNFLKDFLYFGALLMRAIESRSALTARR